MITDFIKNIWKRQHVKKLYVRFPDCLDQMKTVDANFETAISNTIQKLDLYHRESIFKSVYHQAAINTIGVIFVNTQSIDNNYYDDNLINSFVKST